MPKSTKKIFLLPTDKDWSDWRDEQEQDLYNELMEQDPRVMYETFAYIGIESEWVDEFADAIDNYIDDDEDEEAEELVDEMKQEVSEAIEKKGAERLAGLRLIYSKKPIPFMKFTEKRGLFDDR